MRKRQAFLKKVHQLDATLPSSNEAVTAEYLCSDGKAQIDVALPEGGGIFDPLSIGRQRDLNRDIHGAQDQFVPVDMTYQNYIACTAPKRLLIVPGAGHGVSYLVEKERYEEAIKDFWADFDGAINR